MTETAMILRNGNRSARVLKVVVGQDEIRFGRSVCIGLERTLRVPDDGRTYSLPPGLDTFPLYAVKDYADRVPATWRKDDGVFVPVYQHEAVWISFSGRWWKPNAVKIGLNGVNAVSGKPWTDTLSAKPQDYIIVPDQPYLHGFRAARNGVHQFVAPPLAGGAMDGGKLPTQEGHTIEVVVFEPKAGRFPSQEPQDRVRPNTSDQWLSGCGNGSGPAGNGKRLKIAKDEHGIDTWSPSDCGRAFLYLVNSRVFREITGKSPPPSPITAEHYSTYGVPWCDRYNEHGH